MDDHVNSKGEMDHADLLTSMDERIYRAREEACSRKDIMEKVERWLGACNEERWLEEYNMVIPFLLTFIHLLAYKFRQDLGELITASCVKFK